MSKKKSLVINLILILFLICSQFYVQSSAQTDCEPNQSEYIYIPPKKIQDFTAELNRMGKCGYRLEKSNKIPMERLDWDIWAIDYFGVMKLDSPNKYEYQWFEAFSPGEVQTRMNYRAAQGFYFKESYPFQIIAPNRDGDWTDIVTNKYRSTYGSFLIFEKKNDEIKNRDYRILDSDGIGKEVKDQIQKKMNDYLQKGFFPVGIVKQREYYGVVGKNRR